MVKASKYGQMALATKVNGRADSPMVLEHSTTIMETFMLVTSKMIKLMDMVSSNTLTEIITKVLGLMISNMVKALKFLPMDKILLVTLSLDKNQVKDVTNGLTILY